MSTMHCSLLSLGCAFGFAPPAHQGTLTALRALKIAQRRLRPEVRSKLLLVSSARSDHTFIPNAWRFVFLDPGTSGNCRIVTVAAKKSSEHPDTIEAFNSQKGDSGSGTPVIPQNKLLVDSDKALLQVRQNSKLKGVRAAEFQIVQIKGKQEPFWRVNFFTDQSDPVVRFRIGAKTAILEQASAEK